MRPDLEQTYLTARCLRVACESLAALAVDLEYARDPTPADLHRVLQTLHEVQAQCAALQAYVRGSLAMEGSYDG